MKIILLCAGMSSRTNLTYPKCLYKFKDGEMLIEKNLKILRGLGFLNKQIYFATGFKSKLIKTKTFNKYNFDFNNNFKTTNMVYSFNQVLKKVKTDEIIVIYSDILFERKCLIKLIKSNHSISTVIDKDWKKKWKKKSNFLDDLEELKIKNSKIYSLGKKTYDLDDIDGRFLGITKFSKKTINNLKKNFIPKILKENKNIDFTNFLMKLINNNFKVKAISDKFNWHEFDNPKDFKISKKYKNFYS